MSDDRETQAALNSLRVKGVPINGWVCSACHDVQGEGRWWTQTRRCYGTPSDERCINRVCPRCGYGPNLMTKRCRECQAKPHTEHQPQPLPCVVGNVRPLDPEPADDKREPTPTIQALQTDNGGVVRAGTSGVFTMEYWDQMEQLQAETVKRAQQLQDETEKRALDDVRAVVQTMDLLREEVDARVEAADVAGGERMLSRVMEELRRLQPKVQTVREQVERRVESAVAAAVAFAHEEADAKVAAAIEEERQRVRPEAEAERRRHVQQVERFKQQAIAAAVVEAVQASCDATGDRKTALAVARVEARHDRVLQLYNASERRLLAQIEELKASADEIEQRVATKIAAAVARTREEVNVKVSEAFAEGEKRGRARAEEELRQVGQAPQSVAMSMLATLSAAVIQPPVQARPFLKLRVF